MLPKTKKDTRRIKKETDRPIILAMALSRKTATGYVLLDITEIDRRPGETELEWINRHIRAVRRLVKRFREIGDMNGYELAKRTLEKFESHRRSIQKEGSAQQT